MLQLAVGAHQLGVGVLELLGARGQLPAVDLQAVGHLVERSREVAQLVLALRGHAGGEVAAGQAARGPGHVAHRLHDGAPQVDGDPPGDHQDQAQAADPEADGQRRGAVGAPGVVAYDPALERGELLQGAVDLRQQLASAPVDQAALRRRGLVAREHDERARPQGQVVLDAHLEVGQRAALERLLGDQLVQAGELARVALQRLPRGPEKALAPAGREAADAVLDPHQGALQQAGGGEGLLGAQGLARRAALAGHGDDEQAQGRAQQDGHRRAEQQHPGRESFSEGLPHRFVRLRRPEHSTPRPGGVGTRIA